jgi:membrane protease YdiL (CAAX protease family)
MGPAARRGGPGLEAAAIGTAAVANLALVRAGPLPAIPVGLGAAAAVVALARRAGATWDDMALGRRRVGSGLRWGLAVAVPAAAVAAVAAAVPGPRRVVAQRRAVLAPRARFLAHVLLRVPLATALAEEVVFRAGLAALLRRRRSRRGGELAAAALFGLWHVLPTLDEPGVRRASGPGRAAAAGVSVVTTFVAGLGFARLRDVSGSLVAPVLAHAGINEGSLIGGRLAARRLGLVR